MSSRATDQRDASGQPADDPPDSSRRSRTESITRVSTWVLGGSLLALLLTGLPLIWQYEPERRVLVQELHTIASLVFVLAALVLLGTAVLTRIRRLPTHVGWLAALGVFMLSQLAGTSGFALAWDGFALNVVAPLEPDGIFTALDPKVRLIFADGNELTQSDYQMIAVAHLVVVPVALLATYALGRRRNRSAQPAAS